MNIYVSRDGQTFGPYTAEQANQFLQGGQLLASDFALYEGQTEWQTLGLLLGIVDSAISQVGVDQSSVQEHLQDKQAVKIKPIVKEKKRVGERKGARVKINQGQSIVVAKEKSLVSRILSTIIVFGVTCIVVCGAVAGLYYAFPSKVTPIFNKFGFLNQEPLPTEAKLSSVDKEISKDPLEITLNDEDWQRLRSTNVIILATDNGNGFRVISPPEKEQGLNDQDLEALIPLSSKILSLDLTYAEISDRGIHTLSKFVNLQRLYLEGNKKVTVQGLIELKNLTNLTYLNLVRIELNEDLVDLLISMGNLREIYLYETGLNEDSISRLTKARPKVFVNGG